MAAIAKEPFLIRFQKLVLASNKYNDLLLALLLVMIIGLMIFPISTHVLDALLTLNLSISVVLLMMSLYTTNILNFSTFPSLLLFTTLFRLSLNITTTRLILIDGFAGDIINTFGNFVVAGNFVVGTVIFLIILVVQFIVITKGSERVAEVAARFTLDAMPGKQMSIDADMRAGIMDMEEARKKRNMLGMENQLYGSMDGAMKFVKGDAIAGMIITAINIVAGIIIGVMQKGFTIEKAIKTYSILTIGDGLISQIPALLISITAGIIVTRVASDDNEALGKDIGGQLLSQPKALLIGGWLMLAFGLVPGFPTLIFFFFGALTLSVGYALHKSKSQPKESDDPSALPAMASASQKDAAEKNANKDEFSLTVPLMIDVANDVKDLIKPAQLNRELVEVRKALYQDLGVPFPGIHLRFNENVTDGIYRILLQEVPLSQGQMKKEHVFVRESAQNLEMMSIPFVEEKAFLPKIPSLWVPVTHKEQLVAANIAFMEHSQLLTYHLSFILKKYAHEFLGLQETKFIMENMEKQFPELVREVQRVLPIQKICEVFQRLIQEDVSIRNLRTILNTLIEWGAKEKEPVMLTEHIRASLRRYVSYKFSSGQNMLAVYLLETEVEEQIRGSIRQTSAGSYLALSPKIGKQLVQKVKEAVGDIASAQQRVVLLTAMDIRRYLRKLIEAELYELPVLSHQELTEEIIVQPLGRIGL